MSSSEIKGHKQIDGAGNVSTKVTKKPKAKLAGKNQDSTSGEHGLKLRDEDLEARTRSRTRSGQSIWQRRQGACMNASLLIAACAPAMYAGAKFTRPRSSTPQPIQQHVSTPSIALPCATTARPYQSTGAIADFMPPAWFILPSCAVWYKPPLPLLP